MTDWDDLAAPIHFPQPVDPKALRAAPEVYGLAKWFWEQNADVLSDGTVVALGWDECLMMARCIQESDDPWGEHPAVRFAELLTEKLEAIFATPGEKP